MGTHNIGFYEEISKLSLNYHQISSIIILPKIEDFSLVQTAHF